MLETKDFRYLTLTLHTYSGQVRLLSNIHGLDEGLKKGAKVTAELDLSVKILEPRVSVMGVGKVSSVKLEFAFSTDLPLLPFNQFEYTSKGTVQQY
jgi:hypothetical protein